MAGVVRRDGLREAVARVEAVIQHVAEQWADQGIQGELLIPARDVRAALSPLLDAVPATPTADDVRSDAASLNKPAPDVRGHPDAPVDDGLVEQMLAIANEAHAQWAKAVAAAGVLDEKTPRPTEAIVAALVPVIDELLSDRLAWAWVEGNASAHRDIERDEQGLGYRHTPNPYREAFNLGAVHSASRVLDADPDVPTADAVPDVPPDPPAADRDDLSQTLADEAVKAWTWAGPVDGWQEEFRERVRVRVTSAVSRHVADVRARALEDAAVAVDRQLVTGHPFSWASFAPWLRDRAVAEREGKT